MTNPEGWTERQQVLTESDLKQLAKLLSEHPCKFSVTHEEMDDIKRIAAFFGRIEKKIIDGITWGVIAIIGGILWLFYNHGYYLKGK